MAMMVKATSSGSGIEVAMSYCDSAWVTSSARKMPSGPPARGVAEGGQDVVLTLRRDHQWGLHPPAGHVGDRGAEVRAVQAVSASTELSVPDSTSRAPGAAT
jgi:hypothetical protein